MKIEDLLTEIKLLSLQPGDVVVFRTTKPLTKSQQELFLMRVGRVLDDLQVKAMVLPPEIDVELMRKDAES